MRFSTRMWKTLFLTCVVFLTWGICGCALFDVSENTTEPDSLLKQLVGPRNAIDIEVFFVDRHKQDPLIGESLWNSLHEVGAVEPNSRESLEADGFRFRMSPSRPPRQLQSLMDISDQNDPARSTFTRSYTLPSGQQTWLVTSQVPDGTKMSFSSEQGERIIEANNGQCLLRLQAERVEDGWARLTVIPEVRHGQTTLRPQAINQEWVYHKGQETIVVYEDRLTAEMNLGEILVIGLAPNHPDSLGSRFFQPNPDSGIERLMLIRIKDMRQVKAVRAEN